MSNEATFKFCPDCEKVWGCRTRGRLYLCEYCLIPEEVCKQLYGNIDQERCGACKKRRKFIEQNARSDTG